MTRASPTAPTPALAQPGSPAALVPALLRSEDEDDFDADAINDMMEQGDDDEQQQQEEEEEEEDEDEEDESGSELMAEAYEYSDEDE